MQIYIDDLDCDQKIALPSVSLIESMQNGFQITHS